MIKRKTQTREETVLLEADQPAPKQMPLEIVRSEGPVMRFSPTAWAKLLFFRDRGQTEIGGFGISAADDLLRVEDFVTVKQEVSIASVAFDDEAVADLFETQVDVGRRPEEFARVWLHTHPGHSPQPSLTDEETFERVFGNCQWAVMFILARGGKCFARLRFSVGPGGEMVIPVEVEYGKPFGPSDREVWEAEYQANIKASPIGDLFQDSFGYTADEELCGYPSADDWLEELDAMDPAERRLVIDELTARSDLWQESEVIDEY